MSGLKKFLKRKDNKSKNAASTEDLSQSGHEMAGGAAGYLIAKEKDLPKLHKAVWTKDMPKLKQLIKKADINQLDKENRTALHLAAATNNDEVCRFLLSNKAKTNLCDNHGRTPLMKAVEVQSHSCTEVLLEHGADANVVDVMNSSPLHLGSANGEIEIAVLLIGKGAKVNAQDKEGFTPLHVASSLGYQDFVGFLIHEGASINAVDAHGRTSLMTAASEGHIGIVKLLLQNNANTELRDSQGWKASDHAIIQGHHSCSNIIEEHEEKLEAQQRQAQASKPGRKSTNNNNLSGLGGGDLEFSFGGPALDIGAESQSEREQDTASHDSVDENSWNSSGGEDIFEVSKKPAKPSLLAALKPVTRAESDLSAHSQRSSRIPVRTESTRSNTSQVSNQTSPDKPTSRIPVPTTGTPEKQEHQTSSAHSTPTNSPPRTPMLGKATPVKGGQTVSDDEDTPNKNERTPTKGAQTPTKEGQTSIRGGNTPTLGTPTADRANTKLHAPGNASPARLSVDGQQSLPWESIGEISDDESQITESDASEKMAALLSGKGKVHSKESEKPKGSIFMTEPDDKESDLNVTFSDDENSVELPIDDDNDDNDDILNALTKSEPKTASSPVKQPTVPKLTKNEIEKEEEKDSVPKLDLGSSVSSVSDPDVSGASDCKQKKKTKKPGDSIMSEDSEWDTSDDDILPSDDPGTGGSSLFGTGKRTTPLPTKSSSKQIDTKASKNVKPSMDIQDSESEATETESEWEQEAAKKKKLSAKSKEAERDKEEERLKQWQAEKSAKEEALAMEIQKELEMEMEMERLEKESEEKRAEDGREERRRTEERGERQEREREERERLEDEKRQLEERERRQEELRRLEEEKERIRQEQQEKILREKSERERVEEALRTLEREKDEERRRIEREKEEELERQMKLKEEQMMRLQKERDEERQRREKEERRLRLENEKELQRIQLEKEKELERQMKEKEEEMELQRKAYEERLDRERRLLEDREAEEARRRKEEMLRHEELERQRQQEILEKQRKAKEEEDNLLEAYRKKQEELVEQERRFEEEMARRERELEEKMKMKELGKQRPVVEEQLFASQQQQVHATEINDLSAFIKTQDDTITKEKADLETSLSQREQNSLKEKSAILALKNDEEQLKQRHGQLKSKSLQDLATSDEEAELEKLGESMRWKKAQREMLEEEQKAHQDLTDQHALEVKIEMEKRQLQDLETRKDILDRQVGAKLTELANRKRRDELEEKSRQLMQEREQLNASFEAAKRRSAMIELDSSPASLSHEGDDSKRESFDDEGKPSISTKALPNGYVDDVDWSESSDDSNQVANPATAQMLSSSLPRFQSTTKVDGQSPISQTISPIAKTAPLSFAALTPQDAQSSSRMQESLRDAKRQIDKLKERNLTLESSRKHLEKDLAEVQGKLQAALKNKADVEHSRLQSESDNRSLRYKYEQESEARRVAEALLTQLKDQIKRSEEKLAKEMESRQKLENEMRLLLKEKKDNLQTISQQEADLNDLQKALSDEQEARVHMTDMYKDIKKQMDVLMEEARTSTQQKAVVMAELEAVDQTRKTYEANSGSLRDQLLRSQTELAETRARLEAMELTTSKELENLRQKLQKKTDKLGKADEVIAELRAASENQQATISKEHANLNDKLESESLERKRMESEIASLKVRLENANNELDKATLARTQTENTCHNLKDELYQEKLKLEKELASLREANQTLTSKLEHAESKASSLDQELQLSTLTMTEKGGHLNLAQREAEHIKTNLQRAEEKLAIEKGQNAKLSSKLEHTENKLLTLMGEHDSVKRHLELANEKIRKLEEAAVRAEAKYHSAIESLRADLEKNKELMADNKNNLAESMKLLKEDSNKISENNVRREEDIKKLNQELNATTRKLAQTATALEMQIKAREELENDRARLREELRVFEAKLLVTEDRREEVVTRASRLEDQLGQSMRASDEAASRLASRSVDLESVTRSLSQLENLVNRLKSDKAQLAAALKDEQVKCELLLKEIKELNEARQSLEALLTNVKAENIQLEEKIQSEELNRTISGKEAQEAKELWEAELRSRTKLGTKIVNAEKKLAEAQAALDEERRKTRKVLEMKKAVEAKLEAQDDRSSRHHKDILALKSQLKSYKRRLKEYETSESRIPTIRSEFDKERVANESHIASLRRQIDSLSDKLRQEMETRTKLELTNKQLQQELSAAKSNEKEIAFERDRLERTNRQLEEEIQRSTSYYEENYVEKGQLDVFRKELEAKSRYEINRKLEEVNQHLAEESSAREKLDRMREQNVAKTRTEMEQMIADLKSELSRIRSNAHEHETQKDTVAAEAKRFKDLYENELNAKNKLISRLAKANEKVAESKAMLNLERSRRVQTATDRDSGFVTSPKYSPDPLSASFMSRSSRSPRYGQSDDEQLMKAVENELSKSIKRHLDSGPVTTDLDLRPSPLNISDHETNSYPALSHASKEYMSLLQKKYFV